MPDFPTTIDEIDAAFLTSVLGYEITAVAAEPVGAPGELSSGARLRLIAADEARDDHMLFAKYPHPSEQIQAIGQQMGVYRTVVRFYETWGREAGLPVPRCEFAGYDESSGGFLLLFEDLSAGRVGNYFSSSVADVRAVIEELPAVHGRRWHDPELAEQTWLWRVDHPAVVATFHTNLQTTVPLTVERFSIGGAFRTLAEQVAQELPRIARRWNDRPVTLVHGDLHLQQVFFPTDAREVEREHEAGRFALFDWQTAMIANPGIDLAKVITIDLTAADRRLHEGDLVARYHAGLEAVGVADYSFDDCWADYRLGQVWNLVMLMNAGSVADLDAIDRAARASGTTAAEFVGRTGAALADLDVASLIEGS